MATESPVAMEVIATYDGIPTHRIRVATVPDESVEIAIDGVPDEAIWATLPVYDNMLVSIPATGKHGEHVTQSRLFATERGLYISAVMYQPPQTLVTRRSVRDEFIIATRSV
ncbi:MAG: hypothetical protein HC809_00130 [Gammaproteobacteria bacterium]|nr:hypothetical protein [Gammaproteobacteria bacterium]